MHDHNHKTNHKPNPDPNCNSIIGTCSNYIVVIKILSTYMSKYNVTTST